MTEFKCLKVVFMFNFLIMKACAPNNLLCYFTENDVSTRAEAVFCVCSSD